MNITERLETLDIEVLPATIRDAIVACKKLGERYLWIDRLCILQDDERDKVSQVHSMSSIYTGAKFIIIDASSNGINDGIAGVSRARKAQINERLAGLNINVQLPPLWDVVGLTRLTYQEAILPHRKVYFTQSQVFYECAHRIYHEETLAYSSFDHSMHNKVNYPTTTTSLCYNAARDCSYELEKTELSSRSIAEKPWKAYARHLPRYRQRLLRQSSDLLDAFSGIVNALYPGGKSYHGLPTADFDLALLWRQWRDPYIRKIPLNGTPEICIDDPGLFPSWSWASAPDVIAEYDDSYDFCGSLCLWFQPDTNRGQLWPILAPSQAASRWTNITGTLVLDYRRADRNALYKLWIKLLADNVVQSPVCVNAMAWSLKSSSGVTEELAKRWPSYAAFWQDIYGQENAMRDAQTRLAEETHDRIRDGVIVTRAQIGSVEIRRFSGSSPFPRAVPRKWEKFIMHNHHGRDIGQVSNQRIKDFLHGDTGTFECIALSVSAGLVGTKQDSSAEKGSGEEEDENTSESDRSVSEGNKNRGSISTGGHWKLEHWVNVLVIRKEDGYCYRIGSGKIQIDDWLELPRRLETIVLG